MDSMKRIEASHHQNKVVSTNQETYRNNKINGSCSNLNNNTVSSKQQNLEIALNQVSTLPKSPTSSTLTASDINKDSNFEYDDNEWDVGIGDLIIDLDADIEKSSSNNQQQQIQSETVLIGVSSETFLPSLPHVGSHVALGSEDNKTNLKQSQISNVSKITPENCDKITKQLVKEDHPPNSSAQLHISIAASVKEVTTSFKSSNQHPSSPSTNSLPPLISFESEKYNPHHHHRNHHHYKLNSSVDSGNHSKRNLSKNTVLLCQLDSNSKFFETSGNIWNQKLSFGNISSSSSNMSSANTSSGGKSTTKLSVDHQATLDKGLKMKIKRTKPGTKTSEAKHEIVKAEQNGTSSLSSSADENNGNSNSSTSSSNKKHSSLSQSQTQQVAISTIQQQVQQGSKRGSSGHRRDKAKEKNIHHNQRDKNEHNSSASSVDQICSCAHEIQINGIQHPCSDASCIKNKALDQQMSSQTQGLSNQNNSSSSTAISVTPNSNTGSSLNSSNTPNAPGPPSGKDNIKTKSVVPIIIHPSTQISCAATANNSQLSNLQNSSSFSGSSNGINCNKNSSSNSSSISNSVGSSASSTNNVLKSQLQSTTKPSSILDALASGKLSAAGSSYVGSVPSLLPASGTQFFGEKSCSESLKDNKTSPSPPSAKRHKYDPKNMVDVCVGTSVGTITEPDCLGPCEPGTSVTLEGIVWHETEGGVLVVNVTWRGKTYVGTLIDCTKHDWAPPRFCDSPTEELDSRMPKGRAKRSRGSAFFPVNDLSNFTETRSSMHSKLRNGGTKGRGSRATTTTVDSNTVKTTTTTTGSSSSGIISSVCSNTPSTSPVAFLTPRPEKRKSKDKSPSPVNGCSGSTSSSTSGSVINYSNVNNSNISTMANNGTLDTQSAVNPMTGLNVQISTKKCKNSILPCAISPVLLECPEQDCSKKYKHANGLRYHQSHAHGSVSSMDEDSSHPPESPQRLAPATTPSPIQSTTDLPTPTSTADSITTNISSSATTVSTSRTSQPTNSLVVLLNDSSNTPTTTVATSTTTSSTITNRPYPEASPNLLITVNVPAATVSTSHTILTTTTPELAVTAPTHSQPIVTSPFTAGGSNMTCVSGQILPHVTPTTSSTLLSSALTGSSLSVSISSQLQVQTPSPQQEPLLTTPTRCDPLAKSKPGILRFGPLVGEVDQNTRLISIGQGSSNVSGTSESDMQSSNHTIRTINVGATGGILAMESSTPEVPEGLNTKSQNCAKQKKNRKSPGPSVLDVTATNRTEDVQSPAYSDISDDSAPVVDACDLDKSKNSSLPDVPKKPDDIVSGPLGPIPGFGMYPYYPAMPHQPSFYSSDHQGKLPGLGHSPLVPNAAVDYKSKEPPIDLINKPNQHQYQQQQQSLPSQPAQPPSLQVTPGEANAQPNKDCPTGIPTHAGAGKIMQHFYPYGYMPAGYSYNLDSNYGPGSMVSEESKLVQQQQASGQIKEDRIKESCSPNEYTKICPQMISTKLIKSEPIAVKDIKTEVGHTIHTKDQHLPGQQQQQPSISAYSGMFQRQGINAEPLTHPQQHMNREEDLRRLFNYSDQRRSSSSGNLSVSNLNIKDEPQPIQGQSQSPVQSTVNASLPSQQVKGSKNQVTSQSCMKHQKDVKTEDKEMLKIKQEGQKPTMETQGPPPPPTSQYYPHSLYMSAAPFGFDPNHQMYRNMLVPTASYSAPPYHLQIPRYTSPEDLSRNPSTKALDLLQHHASQYYNSHKIHELREGALKSPTSNVKVSVSSPNLSQQSSQNPNMCIPPSNSSISSLQQQHHIPQSSHSQQPTQTGISQQSSQAGGATAANGTAGNTSGPEMQKDTGGPNLMGQGTGTVAAPPPPQLGQPSSRSPPPQRHVHTHHHTHVGLGYPMFQSPYGAVLASQQAAAAVTVISPFQAGPPTK